MKIVSTTGNDELARVYIAKMSEGRYVEFVESIQPPIPREKKWVLIISTLYGCPVGCQMCDAGGDYQGPLTKDEMVAQIDHLIRSRYPDGKVSIPKLKVQFARMGEPALNPAVLDVLCELPDTYQAPGLLPCVSTVAPVGTDRFFTRLKDIKDEHYSNGQFQLQFSIHTTDHSLRNQIIPVRKWSFEKISEYGEYFRDEGDRKVTLNFALARGMPLDADVLANIFHQDTFLIKVTPLNPTLRMRENGLDSHIDPINGNGYGVVDDLRDVGYNVLLSIGELEENKIGSNCGQYLQRYLSEKKELQGGYDSRQVTEVGQPATS